MLNIHHLELFYYVARHQGVSQAAQRIPYGIQQPAISSQILNLERDLKTKLFHRRPFVLTPEGKKLFEFITPFFANLSYIEEIIQGSAGNRLRIAAPSTILLEHFPEMLHELQKSYPRLKLNLFTATQRQAEHLLKEQLVDLAIAVIEEKPSSGIHCEELLRLPLAFVLRTDMKVASSAQLLKMAELKKYPLISFPAGFASTKHFQQELTRRKIKWDHEIEAHSLELIHTYVKNGFGIGLSIGLHKFEKSSKLYSLPLQNFPPLRLGAFWLGNLTPIAEKLFQIAKKRAKNVLYKQD
jgi:DNA-binding transcriptional LysR family regulator